MRLPASLALTSLLLLPLIFAEPALAESRLEQLEALIAATAKGSPRQSPEVMQSLIEAAGAEMKTLSLKALLDACKEIDPESLVRNDEATHDAHVLMYISNHISQRLAGGDDPAPLLQMPLANEPFGRIACRLFALSQYKVHPKASEEKWIPAETLVATLALARALEENDEARKLTMSPALLRYQTLIEITRRKIPVDLADEYATAKRRYLQSNSPGERRVQLKIMQLTGGDQLSDDVAAIARELLAGDARLQATPDVKDLLKLLARSDSPAAAAILRESARRADDPALFLFIARNSTKGVEHDILFTLLEEFERFENSGIASPFYRGLSRSCRRQLLDCMIEDDPRCASHIEGYIPQATTPMIVENWQRILDSRNQALRDAAVLKVISAMETDALLDFLWDVDLTAFSPKVRPLVAESIGR